MNSFSKSAVYTLLTQIPTQLFGIISGIFITRLLGPSGKGVYAIFYADISLFITILGFSINTAIVYFMASQKISIKKLVTISFLFSIITIALSILSMLIWSSSSISSLLFPSNYNSSSYIIWFVIFLIISQINTIYGSFFQGIRRFDIVNKIALLNSLLNLVIFSGLFLTHRYLKVEISLFTILEFGLLVIVFNMIHWHLYFIRLFNFKLDFNITWRNEIKPFLNYMGLGHLSVVINFFNYRLVLWVLIYYLDTTQVGVFSVAIGLSHLLTFISTPLTQVLMPFLSAEKDRRKEKMFTMFARIHFTVILLLAIASLILTPFFIPLLYGKEFSESILAFQILVMGTVLSCQTKLIASFFASKNLMQLNLYATIIGFLLTFYFNFFLIDRYGIYGAALAQTITYAGIFLFLYIAMITFAKSRTLNIFIITKEDLIYLKNKINGQKKEIN